MSNEESALGLRLGEAIRRYSDEQKWRVYEDAATAAAGKRRRGIIALGGQAIAGAHAAHRVHADNALIACREKAWHDVLADFTGRLHSGELVATGLFAPLDARAQRQAIRSELWAVLKLNFSRSSAKGAGCEVFAIRVVHSAEQGGVQAADSTVEVFGDGLVGRPSCMAAIEAEMTARAERGELSETLTDECRQLAQWAKRAFRPRRTPTWKTIRNQLSSVYRQLKSPKKA